MDEPCPGGFCRFQRFRKSLLGRIPAGQYLADGRAPHGLCHQLRIVVPIEDGRHHAGRLGGQEGGQEKARLRNHQRHGVAGLGARGKPCRQQPCRDHQLAMRHRAAGRCQKRGPFLAEAACHRDGIESRTKPVDIADAGLRKPVEQRIGCRDRVFAETRAQFRDRHRRQNAECQWWAWPARDPVLARGVAKRASRVADTDRHDGGVGLGGDARHRSKQAESARVGLGVIGQIDRDPAISPQDADQPAADEHMSGVEGDGAGQFAERLHPPGGRGVPVEDVKRVLGKKCQHQRRIEPAAMRHDIYRAARLVEGRQPIVANQESQFQRCVKSGLPEGYLPGGGKIGR